MAAVRYCQKHVLRVHLTDRHDITDSELKRREHINSNGQFHNCQSWSFITVHGHF